MWRRGLPVADLDWAGQMAHGWAQQVDVIVRGGGVPLTPAIEPGKWHILQPFYEVLFHDYAAELRMAGLSLHPRTLDHPPTYHKDPDCWLGWMDVDHLVNDGVGEHVPIFLTEAGPEPGWNQDKSIPPEVVTPQIHCDWWQEILSTPVPDYYMADCGWLWEGTGAWHGARWKRNTQHMAGADLPVVQMLKTWLPDVPAVPITDAGMRTLAERHGQEIRIFTGGKLYKRAQERDLGYPVTNEWPELGRIWQRYENPAKRTKSVGSVREKTYDDERW